MRSMISVGVEEANESFCLRFEFIERECVDIPEWLEGSGTVRISEKLKLERGRYV